MLKQLETRALGINSTVAFQNKVACHIGESFELWRMSRFPTTHLKPVLSLDVDGLYGQFLLSIDRLGKVRLHNIKHPHLENSTKYRKIAGKFINQAMKFSHTHGKCVQWYPHGISTATTSGDGCIKLWDITQLRSVHAFYPCTLHKSSIHQHHQSLVARSPVIAAATTEDQVPLLDMRYGSISHRLRGHVGPVPIVKWSTSDENLLATGGSDHCVRIWDMRKTQNPVVYCDVNQTSNGPFVSARNRKSHNGAVSSIEFTSDGNKLISIGRDHTIKVWETYTGRPLDINCGNFEIPSVTNFQFAASQKSSPPLIFVPNKLTIVVMNVETGEVVNVLRGHNASVFCVKYNPYYEELYSGGKDRQVLIWRPHQEQSEAINDRVQRRGH